VQGSLPDLHHFVELLQARGPDLADQEADVLRAYAPVAPVNGGKLRDSITGRAEDTQPLTVFLESDDEPVVTYVLEGTEPHEIVAHQQGALAFEWHGAQVFYKRVQHPGTDPNHFDEAAAPEIEQVADQVVEDVAEEAFA
jgi:hypothetical protein